MMQFLKKVLFFAVLIGIAPRALSAESAWAVVPLADGFDFPVGKPNGDGYYKARGLRLAQPRHLGEDWNGMGGGDSDLGDPIYTIGDGLVCYANDARAAWGGVVIIRHAFREPTTGKVLCFQTLYGHLDKITVKLGQIIRRGDQVGTMGTDHGKYPCHLHLELHYNINVGCGHMGVDKNTKNFGDPTRFIQKYRRLRKENRSVRVPVGAVLPYRGSESL